MEDGALAPGLDKLYTEAGWLWAQAAAHRTLCAENFARSMPDIPLKAIVNAPAHTLPAWGGEVAALLEDIQPLCSGGAAVTVMAGTPARRPALPPTCAPKGCRSPPMPPLRAPPGWCRCCRGSYPPGAACRLPGTRSLQPVRSASAVRRKKKAQQGCPEQPERDHRRRSGGTPEPRHRPVCGHPAYDRAGCAEGLSAHRV